jgi:hypothetical protein
MGLMAPSQQTLPPLVFFLGVFVTREHVRHNKSGIAPLLPHYCPIIFVTIYTC